MNQILIITRLTIREAIRRKIVYASLALGIIFLVIYSVGFHYIREQMGQTPYSRINPQTAFNTAFNFLQLAAMYAVNFLSIATAALITADTLAGEISNGIIQSVATKPIYRFQIVCGKWLGNALLLAAYILLMAGGASLSIYLQSGYVAPNLFLGFLLLFENSIMIMTVTLAFSSTLSTLATGGTIFGLFGIAFIGGWVERIGTLLDNRTAVNIGILTSLFMPSESIWNLAANRMTNPLINTLNASPFSSASVPSPLMSGYTVVYLVVFLLIAIRQFSKRDL
jgi:Cu-processing system permease protein